LLLVVFLVGQNKKETKRKKRKKEQKIEKKGSIGWEVSA
jgi:hypothetical protein